MSGRTDFVLPVVEVADLDAEGPRVWEVEGRRSRGIVLRGAAGVPDHQRILDFAHQLGTPMEPVVGVNRDPHLLVHDVRPLGSGLADRHGRPVRSTTYQSIDLHTDGYNAEVPPRLVVLQVVVPGTGGLTTVAAVDDIAARLRPETIELLGRPDYPTASGTTAILTKESERWSMRYNAYELRALLSDRVHISAITNSHIGALSELAEVIDYEESMGTGRIQLFGGDIVVLDNCALLNGRLVLQPNDAERLLHRVWLV